jgi:polyketide synthase 7
LSSASRFRPTFEDPADLIQVPKPVRLASGTGGPNLVCLPTVLATAGPHQYAKFAHSFGGQCDVTALQLPGFADGERLPATMRDAAAVHTEAIAELALQAPVVLVGYSAGGILAYALACHLESVGVVPAGVVLIDTRALARDALAEIMGNLTWAMLAREDVPVPVSDARLTAMAAYGRLLLDWQPIEVAAPTLALRAQVMAPEELAGLEWGGAWELARKTVEVPGDHITMMEEHVDSTAHAVQDWLSTTLTR